MDIGQVIAILERQGLSGQSILHVYNVLHKMFKDASEFYEFIDVNPKTEDRETGLSDNLAYRDRIMAVFSGF